MLYQLNEMGRAMMAPYRIAAQVNSLFLRSPYNLLSYTPQGNVLAAAYDLFEESTRYHGKPEFDLHSTVVDGKTCLVTEEIVWRKAFCEIRHFKRHGADRKSVV